VAEQVSRKQQPVYGLPFCRYKEQKTPPEFMSVLMSVILRLKPEVIYRQSRGDFEE
jgi:hypothetical protein